jgi:zinc/manganese transport system permease protein
VTAIGCAFAASLTGLLVSYYWSVPTGPAIILIAGIFYLVSILVGVKGGLVWGLLPRKHLEA